MVIRKEDRVSTVIARDASLVEVFVAASPVFERLRNPAMRKVMSRLVTVAQAARIAGVDPDTLVAHLNARVAGEPEPVAPDLRRAPDTPEDAVAIVSSPPALDAVPPTAIVELDVREDLRAGREPFSRIMAARKVVPPGGALRLRATFEPVPLYGVMARFGLTHHTERLAEDDWIVWFYAGSDETSTPLAPSGDDAGDVGEDRPTAAAPGASGLAEASDLRDAAPAEDGVVVVDVRGLEPPEPMVRTLEALEALPDGATLVQINVRVPRLLLPQLEARGFTYEVREQGSELVRVFIRRSA